MRLFLVSGIVHTSLHRKNMKLKILFIFIILFMHKLSFGACTGSSPNLTAASANRDDVNDCVTVATYGDTINIPACAQDDCVWTDTISITKDLRIIGAGKTSTYITNGFSDDHVPKYFIKFDLTSDATAQANIDSLDDTNTLEVSGIHFYSTDVMMYKYAINVTNDSIPIIRRVKIHDNSITNFYLALCTHGYVYGVMYNNTIYNSRTWKGGGPDTVAAWTNMPLYPGEGGPLYIEDNEITFNLSSDPENISALTSGANAGGGQVFRFNTASGTMVSGVINDTHSIAGGGVKGSQLTEIYGNSFPMAGAGTGINMRGGRLRVFNNILRADNNIVMRQETYDSYSTPPTTVYPDSTAWSEMQQRRNCTASETPYACCTGYKAGTCNTSQVCSVTANNCYKIHDSYIVNNRTAAGALVEAEVYQDAWNVAYRLLELDVAPATDWEVDDVITGQTSGKTATVNVKESSTVYYVTSSSATEYTDGEVIGVTGNADKLANQGTGYPKFTLWVTNDPPELVENREVWFQRAAEFTGLVPILGTSSGVGCGTAETMNAIETCTDGVGFWVPNATIDVDATSCSDLTTFVGANNAKALAVSGNIGTLYKCASNTWVATYTPYTYPHPLRGTGKASVSIGSGAAMSIGSGATATLY
jgi:hypothetical protein